MRTQISRAKPEEFEKVLSTLVEHGMLQGTPEEWTRPYVFVWRSNDAFVQEVREWLEESGAAARVLDTRIFTFVVCDDDVAAVGFKIRFG